jgi:hypothetical protein
MSDVKFNFDISNNENNTMFSSNIRGNSRIPFDDIKMRMQSKIGQLFKKYCGDIFEAT